MKTILQTSLLYLVFSTLAIGVAGWWAGFPENELPVEVLQDPRTSFSDEALRAILESDALRKAAAPQLIVLGASGAQEAYPPAELQPFLSELQANNLAIGAANLGEMREVFEHCRKAIPKRVAVDSVVVLGLSYPLFVADEVRWRNPEFVSPDIIASGLYLSDLKRESRRSPLFLDSANPVFKILPGPLLSLAKSRALFWSDFGRAHREHPADPLLEWQGWRWRLPKRHAGDRNLFPDRERRPSKASQTPREQMDWLTAYMGSEPGVLVPQQFEAFEKLVHEIRDSGMRVVVVDMPLPSWHRASSPFVAPYRERLAAGFVAFDGDPAVSFLDLSASSPDEAFRDSIHPAAAARPEWCDRLASSLRPILEGDGL